MKALTWHGKGNIRRVDRSALADMKAQIRKDRFDRPAAGVITSARPVEDDGERHGLLATIPDRLNADLKEFIG
jgi:hypothetical protein